MKVAYNYSNNKKETIFYFEVSSMLLFILQLYVALKHYYTIVIVHTLKQQRADTVNIHQYLLS